jgi:hypothetical protein
MLKAPLLYNHSASEMVAVMDTLVDFDNDGLTNDEEIARGTDRTNPDTDGDGFLDGAEVRLGTNPLDAKSIFKMAALATSGTGQTITLTWSPSVAGNVYDIEMSQTLAPGSWVKIGSHQAAGGPSESATVANPAAGQARAFYRVRLGTAAPSP